MGTAVVAGKRPANTIADERARSPLSGGRQVSGRLGVLRISFIRIREIIILDNGVLIYEKVL
jgi:hypothetical protein